MGLPYHVLYFRGDVATLTIKEFLASYIVHGPERVCREKVTHRAERTTPGILTINHSIKRSHIHHIHKTCRCLCVICIKASFTRLLQAGCRTYKTQYISSVVKSSLVKTLYKINILYIVHFKRCSCQEYIKTVSPDALHEINLLIYRTDTLPYVKFPFAVTEASTLMFTYFTNFTGLTTQLILSNYDSLLCYRWAGVGQAEGGTWLRWECGSEGHHISGPQLLRIG